MAAAKATPAFRFATGPSVEDGAAFYRASDPSTPIAREDAEVGDVVEFPDGCAGTLREDGHVQLFESEWARFTRLLPEVEVTEIASPRVSVDPLTLVAKENQRPR